MDLQFGTDEELCHLNLEGVRYSCRIAWNDRPRTAPIVYAGSVLAHTFAHTFISSQVDQRLHDTATLVRVDLPGTGLSDDLPPDAGADFLIRVLLHVLDEMGLPPVNLLGMSATGLLALRFAQENPRRVRRLALVGTPAHWRTGINVEEIREWFHHGRFEGNFLRALLDEKRINGGSDAHAPVPDRALEKLRATVALSSMAQIIRVLRVSDAIMAHTGPATGYEGPTLAFTGEHDPLTTPDLCRELAAGIRGSLFTTIRDCDHMLHLERSDEFTEVLTRFFTDRPLDDLPYLTEIAASGGGGG